jgi:hypothetical protein
MIYFPQPQRCGIVTIFYGSISDFGKVTVTVPVPAPYLDRKKLIFQKKNWTFFFLFTFKLFYKEKVDKFQQIYGKM